MKFLSIKVRLGILFLTCFSSFSFAEKIALYSDSGVWKPSLKHTEKLLWKMGHTTLRVSAKDVIRGRLQLGDLSAIVIPGGKSWIYRSSLGEDGGNNIRNFVSEGGGYIGFCAGAFYALSEREGGNTTGPYGIGLLQGTAVDADSLNYPGYERGMKNISFYLTEFKEKYKVIFLSGPIFRFSNEEAQKKNVRVNARYEDGEIAGIHFNYNRGRVFVTGPHPEVEERINFLLQFKYRDPDSEWPLVKRMIEFVLTGAEPPLRTR